MTITFSPCLALAPLATYLARRGSSHAGLLEVPAIGFDARRGSSTARLHLL